MLRHPLSRARFGRTAMDLLIVQVEVSADLSGTQFTTVSGLVFNVFCSFTAQTTSSWV